MASNLEFLEWAYKHGVEIKFSTLYDNVISPEDNQVMAVISNSAEITTLCGAGNTADEALTDLAARVRVMESFWIKANKQREMTPFSVEPDCSDSDKVKRFLIWATMNGVNVQVEPNNAISMVVYLENLRLSAMRGPSRVGATAEEAILKLANYVMSHSTGTVFASETYQVATDF